MQKQIAAIFAVCLFVLMLAGCGQPGTAPAESASASVPAEPASAEPAASPAVADASQMTTVEDVTEEGMIPVEAEALREGDYPVEVKSSSSMFSIESAVLHVREGSMEVTLTMGGKGYLYVFPGTAPEAASGEESSYILYAEDADGAHTFTVPVKALDEGFPCAAFSRNKELWYDRTLLLRADSLPREAFREGFFTTAESLGIADGEYTVQVTLAGGSGKAQVASPAELAVKDGQAEAVIVWSSSNYDYMKVDGVQILPQADTATSTFVVPVAFFDRPMAVVADTVAMSEPHEIRYTLRFDSESIEAAK